MYVLAADESILDPSLIPYLGSPVYLRLVTTLSRAKTYAAAGFHVCVTRGLAGGCRDLAVSISGTGPSSCKDPLGRADLTALWADAATAYATAYRDAVAGQALSYVVARLSSANGLADKGYAQEGVDPPRDPMTGASEPPQMVQAGIGTPGLILGGLLLGGLLFGKKKKRAKIVRRHLRRR